MVRYTRLPYDQFPTHCLSERYRYLNLILQNPDGHPLKGSDKSRTLFDSWYAHWRGPPFVKSTGSAQWFNRKDLEAHRFRDAVRSMHFVSKDAWDVLDAWDVSTERAPEQRLMKDHSVPVKILRREIKAKNFATVDQLEQFLIDRYRVAVITKIEDGRLSKNLKAHMPDGDHSEYARYNDPRVKIQRSIDHLEWLKNRSEPWQPLPLT